jgi:hypothetical protein
MHSIVSIYNVQRFNYINKNLQILQEDVSRRMQMIPDLAVRCDRLCHFETSQNAKKLRSQLTNLQERLGALKLAMIEKKGQLKNTIKESEKRKKEMDDYESGAQKLQMWVMDTKQMTLPQSSISPDYAQLQQVCQY